MIQRSNLMSFTPAVTTLFQKSIVKEFNLPNSVSLVAESSTRVPFKYLTVFSKFYIVSVIESNLSKLTFSRLPKGVLFYSYQQRLFVIFSNPSFLRHSTKLFFLSMSRLAYILMMASGGFYKIVQFVGFRFRQRWFRDASVVRFRIGYNKRLWFNCPLDFIMFTKKNNPRKRTGFYFSFDQRKLTHLVLFFYSFRKATIYKAKGLNLKEQPLVLKEGKKTRW